MGTKSFLKLHNLQLHLNTNTTIVDCINFAAMSQSTLETKSNGQVICKSKSDCKRKIELANQLLSLSSWWSVFSVTLYRLFFKPAVKLECFTLWTYGLVFRSLSHQPVAFKCFKNDYYYGKSYRRRRNGFHRSFWTQSWRNHFLSILGSYHPWTQNCIPEWL